MKLAIFLTLAVIVPASAQLGKMNPAATAAVKSGTTGAAPAPLATIESLEKEMDGRISGTGGPTPCIVLGPSRGLYVNGLGAVFTAEVELVNTPGGIGLFQTQVGPDLKAKIHKDKLAHVPLLQQTLREMAASLSASPVLKMSDSDQVVVAVRLVYRSWEDTTGLPGEIVVRIDRRGAAPRVDVQ